jgi:hypothetical protein
MLMLIIVVLLVLFLFGGFRSYYGGPQPGWNNGAYGFGGVGLILFILLLWFLFNGGFGGHHSIRF